MNKAEKNRAKNAAKKAKKRRMTALESKATSLEIEAKLVTSRHQQRWRQHLASLGRKYKVENIRRIGKHNAKSRTKSLARGNSVKPRGDVFERFCDETGQSVRCIERIPLIETDTLLMVQVSKQIGIHLDLPSLGFEFTNYSHTMTTNNSQQLWGKYRSLEGFTPAETKTNKLPLWVAAKNKG